MMGISILITDVMRKTRIAVCFPCLFYCYVWEAGKIMTAHELAKELLNNEDLPLMIIIDMSEEGKEDTYLD